MTIHKLFSAVSVATAVALATSASMATPLVGNPQNGPPSLSAGFNGVTNFDVGLASGAGIGIFDVLIAQPQLGIALGDNAAVAITPHTAWQANNTGLSTGGFWVSFADTGGQAPNPTVNNAGVVNGSGVPVATYKLDFTTGSTMAHMGLWIYADDTAEFFISGGDIFDGDETANAGVHGFDDGLDDDRQRIGPLANTSQGTCAVGVIGCQPGEQAFVEMFWLSPNQTYTIEIDTFQIGGGPFGLLFAGGLQNVPEPATLALLGLGVLGLGVVRRRRKAA